MQLPCVPLLKPLCCSNRAVSQCNLTKFDNLLILLCFTVLVNSCLLCVEGNWTVVVLIHIDVVSFKHRSSLPTDPLIVPFLSSTSLFAHHLMISNIFWIHYLVPYKCNCSTIMLNAKQAVDSYTVSRCSIEWSKLGHVTPTYSRETIGLQYWNFNKKY